MANYLARIFVAGARVGFEARPSLPPAAIVPKMGNSESGDEVLFDPAAEHPASGAETDTAPTPALVEPILQKRSTEAHELSRPAAKQWVRPIQTSSTLSAGLSPIKDERSSSRSPSVESKPSAASHRDEQPPALLPLRREVEPTEQVSEQVFIADRRSEPAQEESNPKAATSGQPKAEVPLPQRMPSAGELAARKVPPAERKSGSLPTVAARTGLQPRQSHRAVLQPTSSAVRDVTNELRTEPGSLPVFPLRGSRNNEHETRITIGRVDVQVNHQPTPPPRRPAPRTISSRQDTLRGRFLDRFTLRP